MSPPPPSPAARALLWRCQRRARQGKVSALRTWDPHLETPAVQELVAAGLLLPPEEEEDPGSFRLAPALPPPPPVPYALDEALMPPPEDLGPPGPSLSGLLEDIAVLAAAWTLTPPRLTVDGTLDVATCKRIGRRLLDEGLAARGRVGESQPRWSRALRVMTALGAVRFADITRLAEPTPALRALLDQPLTERLDQVARRLVDVDEHPLLPAVRAALAQADTLAVDEVILRDLLAEQHRDILYSPWGAPGRHTYPRVPGEALRLYDRDAFDELEGAALDRTLTALEAAGLLRRAPGVFAATPDGRRWAGLPEPARPALWVGGDLELVVPSGALEPWERYLIELASHPVSRDVVDRLRVSRRDLERARGHIPPEELLALLERRSAHPLSAQARHLLGVGSALSRS